MFALNLATGVPMADFPGGRLRAYSTKDGAMDGPGPAIVVGVLYVNSGYGFNGGMPGNVLLAFSIDGK